MKCQYCNSEDKKKYEWANISRKYKRDLKDWIRLCTKCHIIYDGSRKGINKKYPRLSFKKFISKKL